MIHASRLAAPLAFQDLCGHIGDSVPAGTTFEARFRTSTY